MKSKLLLLTAFLQLAFGTSASISVTALRTEGMENPLGIDAAKPRFSWKTEATTETNVRQKAYQILVASTAERLAQNEADVWNSGKVSSDAQLWIPFAGETLISNGK